MASATAPASAQVSCVQVGNAFVSQYYNVLHQSPQVVHRFYTDVSKLTRADAGPDGAVETVSTQNEIHQKVMSMDYGDFKAEIKTVDSQDSLNGGVLVMVTGALSSKSTGKRNFVQTFFLAPQEKGYFVLNDIFRYLDDGSELDKAPYGLANGISESTVSPVPETEEQIVRESSHPLASEDEVLEEEPYVLAEPVEEPEPEGEVAETIEEAEVPPPNEEPEGPAPEASSPPQEDIQGEAPKKSYASILRMKESMGWSPVPAAKAAPVKTVSASADRTAASPPHVVSPPAAVTPPQETADENAPSDSEADKRAIYIKNLPMNIMEHQLEAEFKRFGQIKPGAIQVRTLKQQGYCYAFIEFEDQRAAQSALEASGLPIGGRPAYIEEKKATGTGVRGRYTERGSYRNEGGRGRGYYGGRGGDRDSGGRGGFGGRGGGRGGGGGGYANSNDSGNANDEGFRRYDSQRPQRRAGGNRNGRSSTAAAAE